MTQVYYQKAQGYYQNPYYNAQGQLAREQVRIPGLNAVDTWYGYDNYLRPTTTTYPDSDQVTTTYNSMGLPQTLHSLVYGMIIDNAQYDVAEETT